MADDPESGPCISLSRRAFLGGLPFSVLACASRGRIEGGLSSGAPFGGSLTTPTQRGELPMTTFVLVHGSNGGGWVWKKLAPLLRANGHDVFAPTLTGMSDRSHTLKSGVNLTTHITDITNLLFYEDLSDVVLVGNSYAGMVITGVAAKAPERLKLLVYLDAYVPSDGQCEFDLLPATMRAAREAEAAAHGGLLQPPPPAIFGITDPELTAWIKARSTLQPVSTYSEPVPTGNAKSAAIPRVFIRCTGNPPTTPDLFSASAEKARANGWKVHELATGHLAMLSAPRELAHLLIGLASAPV